LNVFLLFKFVLLFYILLDFNCYFLLLIVVLGGRTL
jgi:hypothetical protein